MLWRSHIDLALINCVILRAFSLLDGFGPWIFFVVVGIGRGVNLNIPAVAGL